jgi:hypothetical protein
LDHRRVGADAFFRAGAGQDLIGDCIGLALNFHCSPLEFADLPMSMVHDLIRELIDFKDR